MRILLVMAFGLWAGAALADPVGQSGAVSQEGIVTQNPTDEGLQNWITGFRPRALAAGISAATFDRAFADIRYAPEIVEKDRRQNEFTKTIWDYLDTAVSDDRVAGGIAALDRHRPLLERIEATYGVPKEIVVAVWGLESSYGGFRGDHPLIGSLATLAYDGRRGAFFEAQLIAALTILENGDTTPDRMTGSWAGAMGHTQFMPLSYLNHAVDFDGDGRRDIWGDDPADALASTAAYLAASGWKKGQTWGLEVTLPEGFDYAQSGERVVKTSQSWMALGIRGADGGALPDHGLGSVLLPAGHKGAAFLIFANFRAIEAYNTADAYVIAVGHLADRIGGGPPIRADWPREDRALLEAERIELQERLTGAGFDTGGIDGRIGPKTIAAVKAWQGSRGLVQDGYASLDVLRRLQ